MCAHRLAALRGRAAGITGAALLMGFIAVTNLQGGLPDFLLKTVTGTQFGSPIAGLTPSELQRFQSGLEEFSAEEDEADGVGPVFNGRSCVVCHDGPAAGGGSAVLSTRIGTHIKGKWNALTDRGGPVIQNFGIIGLEEFQFAGEVVPPEATVVAKRRATAMFGYGLVDAVEDATLMSLANSQKKSAPDLAGRPNFVTNLRTGKQNVGRFGWKAQRATVFDFAAEAYLQEMGVSTPVPFPDADGSYVSSELCPQGNCDQLLFNPSGQGPDEADLDGPMAFDDFIRMLAPPPLGPVTSEVTMGGKVFVEIGCAVCHQQRMVTGPSDIAALSRVAFEPYSDFLLHDIGTGDGTEQGVATAGEMRTAPLWGLRHQPAFLHDNRAATIEDAIAQHAGQAKRVVRSYQSLDKRRKSALLAFLNSL